eukprot:scaffold240658_cov55-Attheya_sp.AAC.1
MEEVGNAVEESKPSTSLVRSLVAGGLAGTTVDVALFPMDTVKTRLQSPQGFRAAGGFTGMYRGLGAAAVGSAPGAALFFGVYEQMKPRSKQLQRSYGIFPENAAFSHMAAACLGEAAACLVRVPTEVLKSKMQTNAAGSQTLLSTLQLVLKEPPAASFVPFLGGLYRGYGITLMREVPFALIQFPIYERLKVEWSVQRKGGQPTSPIEGAACGSVGGAIAAACTTPLDVMKTRLMLGRDKHGIPYRHALDVVTRISAEEGTATFFHGIQPRVMWISIGGFVFFGAYEFYSSLLPPIL